MRRPNSGDIQVAENSDLEPHQVLVPLELVDELTQEFANTNLEILPAYCEEVQLSPSLFKKLMKSMNDDDSKPEDPGLNDTWPTM